MSDKKLTIIDRKIKIPKFRFWLIWLLLFVCPSIIATIGFNKFSEEYAYFDRTDLISDAFEKIRIYNHKVAPENYLKEQIKELQKLDSFKDLDELKRDIDETLCGETLLCLFYDEKIEKISIKKKNDDSSIKNIPITFFKKHIRSLFKNENQSNNSDNNEREDSKSVEKFGIFLQQLFKTASNITVRTNDVSKNFSVKYDGEIYFIFCNFNNPNKDCIGFLAVMRGKDFAFRKMLERLNLEYHNIRIVFREVDVNKCYNNPEIFHSGLKREKDGLHILAPLSAKFVRHVLHGGGTELIEKYGNLFPFIDYHIPLWEYQEEERQIKRAIKFLSLLIILLSGLYFLNVSLFGFNERISFKKKMLLLTLISAIFPFGIFSLSIYTIKKYESFIDKLQVKQYTETVLQLYTNELEQYLVKIEIELSKYADKLSEIYSREDMDVSEFLDCFNSIGVESFEEESVDKESSNYKKLPISYEFLYFEEVPDKLENFCEKNKIIRKYPKSISKLFLNDAEDAMVELYTKIAFKCAKEEFPSSRERQDFIEVGGKEMDNYALNDYLKSNGKLQNLNQLYATSFFTIHYLYNYRKGDNKIDGMLFINLEPKPIVAKFLPESSIGKNKFKEKKGKYIIDYAFLPVENSGTAPVWENGSGNIASKAREICLQNPFSGSINYGNSIIIKKRNQMVSHLAVATITNTDNSNDTLFILFVIVGLIAYLSLILLLASSLLDYFIVEPVMLLASSASAIARGGEKWEAEIKSGDEFEELNNGFKQLVIGLQERNILKSYVSEDAFSDIEESDSLKLLPGGEYLEATIVFSAIKDYDKLSSSITPEESIKLLSKFMSIAEEVTKKHGGSIDKIIGDTIMLVFRDNPNKESHGLRAAIASLELVEKAKASELPKLYTGIASGRVISGRIGSYSGKLDFTVIGNPVNSASRFKTESKNGTSETGIIISGTTIGLTKGKAKVKFLRRVSIKGKVRKYNIYELLGVRDS